jgi:hypothetical protein
MGLWEEHWDRSRRVMAAGRGVPTGAVLLLNTRHLRAVGPIVFAAALLALYGFGVGVAYATFYALDAIGPMGFVREDLAPLPLFVAFRQYLDWLLSLPLLQMRHEITALLSNPRSVVDVANPKPTFKGVWNAAVNFALLPR